MTTFLIQRTKIIRQVEFFPVEASSPEEAAHLAVEYSDPRPEEHTLDEYMELVASGDTAEVNGQLAV